jgi:hypothetical protein
VDVAKGDGAGVVAAVRCLLLLSLLLLSVVEPLRLLGDDGAVLGVLVRLLGDVGAVVGVLVVELVAAALERTISIAAAVAVAVSVSVDVVDGVKVPAGEAASPCRRLEGLVLLLMPLLPWLCS